VRHVAPSRDGETRLLHPPPRHAARRPAAARRFRCHLAPPQPAGVEGFRPPAASSRRKRRAVYTQRAASNRACADMMNVPFPPACRRLAGKERAVAARPAGRGRQQLFCRGRLSELCRGELRRWRGRRRLCRARRRTDAEGDASEARQQNRRAGGAPRDVKGGSAGA